MSLLRIAKVKYPLSGFCLNNKKKGDSSLVLLPCFIYRIFRMKLQTDQENSNYFMRLGNTALSHWGGALVAGAKPSRTLSD